MLGASSEEPASWVAAPPAASLPNTPSTEPSPSTAPSLSHSPLGAAAPPPSTAASAATSRPLLQQQSSNTLLNEQLNHQLSRTRLDEIPSTSSGCSSTKEAVADRGSTEDMTSSSSSAPPTRKRRATFKLNLKYAEKLKRIASHQPGTLSRIGMLAVKIASGDNVSVLEVTPPYVPPPQPPQRLMDDAARRSSNPAAFDQRGECRVGSAGPGPSSVQMAPPHASPVAEIQAPPPGHPMQQRPPGGNSLLVNLLSGQQQPGQVAVPHPPPSAGAPRSFSPYGYPPATPHPNGQPMDQHQAAAYHQHQQMEQRRMMMQQQQQVAAQQQAVAQQQAQAQAAHQAQAQAMAQQQLQQQQQAQQQQMAAQQQAMQQQQMQQQQINTPTSIQQPGTPGGYFNPSTPASTPGQRPPMYAGPPGPSQQPPQMYPLQSPGAVQQQRMPQYPVPMQAAGAVPFRNAAEVEAAPTPPKKRKKPTKKQQQKEAELAAQQQSQQQQQQQQQQQHFYQEQRMMHPAAMTGMMQYPPGYQGGPGMVPQQAGYAYPQQGAPMSQQQIWNQQQMQQRMYMQQQQAAAAQGQGWNQMPGQARPPPVPYPTAVGHMEGGPGSAHASVSQRTSADYSQDGTSPAAFAQSQQHMMINHQQHPGHPHFNRTDSQGSVFGYPPHAGREVDAVDKLFSSQDDPLADLGDLDDIEPMHELSGALGEGGASSLDLLSQSPRANAAQTQHTTPNGDRIDSSIASVVEMVSKSSTAPQPPNAALVTQPATQVAAPQTPSSSSSSSTSAPIKRRPSNSQIAASIVANAEQQMHTEQRHVHPGMQQMMGATGHVPHGAQTGIVPPPHLQSHQTPTTSASEHNVRAPSYGRAKAAAAERAENGARVNGHDQPPTRVSKAGSAPNGSRRAAQSQSTPRIGGTDNDVDADEQTKNKIAEVVATVLAQEQRSKAAAAEQKAAKQPKKNRRKPDLSKEASPTRNEEEIYPFAEAPVRRRGPTTSSVQQATTNFQATLQRQQMLKQPNVQPKQ